jgi:putative ABC transport system permease protein
VPPALTVVGVVKTIKSGRLDEAASPHVYASIFQRSGRSLGFLVKTRTGADEVRQRMRQAIAAADAELPVFAMESLDETIGRSIAKQRFSANALTAFAAAALLLVACGVYAVMAYAVTSRTQEIGLRIAMGARPSGVLASVLGEALRVSLTGVVIGLTLAAAATTFIRTMLFGVSRMDPGVFAAASVLLIATTVLASYLPARRAARVDPVVSLRCE